MLHPIAIHAFNPGPMTGAGNSTWLLRGRVPTLVDAGTGDPRHLEALEHALEGETLAHVLVTHSHTDHASGAPAIAARMPNVRFRKMRWPERDAKWPVDWQPLADGDVIAAGDEELVAVHTPGHAPDHLCFWHAESRTLFCGDLAVSGSTVWIPASLGGDLADYLRSLQRVRELGPSRMLPAHGPVIEDPERLLRQCLEHRLEREAQIVEALRGGAGTVDAIVARVYRGLKDRLVPLARDGVVAHLVKLQREGRVAGERDAWHMIEP
jgi:glyoxylase-like metal-dependent hydrolase (beta-lactamase superfamily II)